MSVTFAPQFDANRIKGWNIIKTDSYAPLEDWGKVIASFDSYEAAAAEYQARDLEPLFYSIDAETDDTPELNVANMNAVTLLQEIGLYDGELVGSIDPTELLDRIIVLDIFEDEGTETIEYGGGGTATVYDVGRRAGTFNRYAAALRKVAEYAQAKGIPVTYA